jgi:hypothetical protein
MGEPGSHSLFSYLSVDDVDRFHDELIANAADALSWDPWQDEVATV